VGSLDAVVVVPLEVGGVVTGPLVRAVAPQAVAAIADISTMDRIIVLLIYRFLRR